MEYIMNRNIRVASTLGHTVEFKKGEPAHVPPCMYIQVQECGGMPADGEAAYIDDEVKEYVPTGEERRKVISEAMSRMVAENKRGDFGANGLPNVKKLSARIGFNVDGKERLAVWVQHRKDGAS